MRNLSMATKTIGGGNLTAVRAREAKKGQGSALGKKLIATFLMIAMLFCMSGVMANDVEDNGIPQGYIAIATKSEDLGDGITLEKTLAVEQSRGRAGFSGQRSTMVIHRYFQNSVEKLAINAFAAFSSTAGQDVCYLDDYRYNITNPGIYGTWNFYDISESTVSNASGNGRYAKYVVNYGVNRLPIGYPRIGEMWIQCTSKDSLTTSGNQEWRNAIAQDDVVIYDNVAYQFN